MVWKTDRGEGNSQNDIKGIPNKAANLSQSVLKVEGKDFCIKEGTK